MHPQFYMPTRVVTGEGCVLAQRKLLLPLGKRALVVTGAHSAKASGALDDLLSALEANGQTYTLFDRAVPNPTVESVYQGAALARESGADWVAAIGGGSPMDTAKVIALTAAQDFPPETLFSGQYAPKALPLACIPTTAGTGSEVTQYAILTNDAAQTKTSIAASVLFPKLAFLDGRYTAGLSQAVAVNTALDALSHCAEGMLSNLAGAISSALAMEGLRRISSCFGALERGELTRQQRESLLIASTLGGMVISATGTTAVHAMGYSLTYFKGIPHGRANGLLLPAFLRFCAGAAPELTEAILHGCGCSDLEAFSGALDGLLGEREHLTEQEAADYAARAAKTGNIAKSAVPVSATDLEAMLRESMCR